MVENAYVRNHGGEGFHDIRTGRFLIILETAGDENDRCQYQAEVELKWKTSIWVR